MKKLLCCLLFAAAVAPTISAETISPADQVAQMKRGVNIVGYDPLWQDAAKARFKTISLVCSSTWCISRS